MKKPGDMTSFVIDIETPRGRKARMQFYCVVSPDGENLSIKGEPLESDSLHKNEVDSVTAILIDEAQKRVAEWLNE